MNNDVPRFKNLKEFIDWWESDYAKTLRNKEPSIINHPNIRRWVQKMLDSAQESPSVTSAERRLLKSILEDEDFSETIKATTPSQSSTIEKEDVSEEEDFFTERYRIVEQVAEGGFGVVYKAYDTQLDRIVALKLLKLRTEGEIREFEKEAKTAAKLRHPNIITVHDLGVEDGQPYFTMDFIEGTTLRGLMEQQKYLSVVDAFKMIVCVTDALTYAHSEGIIHRDIKPENIFIDREGRVYLGDFGVAKRVEVGGATASRIVGTPYYMSPEQANGEKLDGRTDMWSLGVVLYEALCGKKPFEGKTTINIFKRIWFSEPVSMRKLNPRIDRDAETIVMKCLEKEADKRYGAMEDLKADMERYLRGEPIKARPVGLFEKLYRKAKRHKVATLSVLVVVLVLVVTGIVLYRRGLEEEAELERRQREAVRLLSEASAAFEKGDYERALGLVSKSLTLNETEEARRLYEDCSGRIAERKQRDAARKKAEEILKRLSLVASLEEKLKVYDDAIRAAPFWQKLYLDKGELLKRNNRYEEAVKVFEKAVELAREQGERSGEAVAHFHIGMILWEEGRGGLIAGEGSVKETVRDAVKVREALRHFKKVGELLPDVRNPMTLFAEAMEADQRGEYDRAIELLSEAIKRKPDFAYGFYNRGNVWADKGELDKAITDYNKAIELDPKLAAAFNNRGVAWANKGDYDRAIEDYTKAIELDPKLWQAFYSRGNAWCKRGELGKAIADYNKAIQLNPKLAEAFYNRGVAWAERGEFDKAIADYTKAIELSPRDAEAFNNRGVAWYKKGEFDRAIADYTKAIELNRQDADVFYNRGVAWAEKGEFDRAIADYTKALELNPQHWRAWGNLAFLYQRQDRLEDAVKAWTELLKLNPRVPVAYQNRAMLLYKLKRYKRVVEDYEKLVELVPKNATVWYNLACAYAMSGDKDKALKALERAFELDESGGLRKHAETDSDLNSLRADPTFKRLMGN